MTAELLGLFTVSVSILVAVNVPFYKADDFFSEKFKEDLSNLLCRETPAKSSWPEYFVRLFDRIFSKKGLPKNSPEWRKHLSWTCFWRSLAASTIAIVVVSLVAQTKFEIVGLQLARWRHAREIGVPMHMILTTDLASLTAPTLLPGYLALLVTRYFLQFIRANPSLRRISGVVAADFFAKVSIFLFVSVPVRWWLIAIVGTLSGASVLSLSSSAVVLTLIAGWKSILFLVPGRLSHWSIYFYAILFTSIWLWLFGLSQLLIRFLATVGPLRRRLEYVLPVKERPFRSIGMVASGIALFGYWAWRIAGSAIT